MRLGAYSAGRALGMRLGAYSAGGREGPGNEARGLQCREGGREGPGNEARGLQCGVQQVLHSPSHSRCTVHVHVHVLC